MHSFLKAIPDVKAKDAREHHDACPSSRQSHRQKVLGRLRAHEDPPPLFISLFFRKWWVAMSQALLTPPLVFPGGICPDSHSRWCQPEAGTASPGHEGWPGMGLGLLLETRGR